MATAAAMRRVWFLSDSHIGQHAEGRDGADWLQLAVDDMRREPALDFIVHLGDMSSGASEAQLEAYAAIRDASGMGPWYEMPGNHDFRSIEPGLYDRYVGCPRYWTIRDGNLLFLSLPVEQSSATGLFEPGVDRWLRHCITAAGDVNVVICAHTFPRNTVTYSERPHRHLHPPEAVEAFLRDMPISLWMGGHIHFSPRAHTDAVHRGATWFINAASVSHVYGTNAASSFVLELKSGARSFNARYRDHERAAFVPEWFVTGELRYPVELGQTPVFKAYAVDPAAG